MNSIIILICIIIVIILVLILSREHYNDVSLNNVIDMINETNLKINNLEASGTLTANNIVSSDGMNIIGDVNITKEDDKIKSSLSNRQLNINNSAINNSNEATLTDIKLSFMHDKNNNKYNTFSQTGLTMDNGNINVNNGAIFQKGVRFIFDYNGTIGFCKNKNGAAVGNYNAGNVMIWGFYDDINKAAIINSNFLDFNFGNKTEGNWIHLLYVKANGLTFYCYKPTDTSNIRGNYIAGKIYCTAGESMHLNASNPTPHKYYILCYYYNKIKAGETSYNNYVVRGDNGDDFNWNGDWCLFKLHDVEMTTDSDKKYRY